MAVAQVGDTILSVEHQAYPVCLQLVEKLVEITTGQEEATLATDSLVLDLQTVSTDAVEVLVLVPMDQMLMAVLA
jgi:hypothetical protein